MPFAIKCSGGDSPHFGSYFNPLSEYRLVPECPTHLGKGLYYTRIVAESVIKRLEGHVKYTQAYPSL
jgi:hypothetical protein